MRLIKIKKKSIIPLLMATVFLLAGFNTHTILGHNFSPDENASFLALVNTLKAEAQMVQQNLATNNMSLASDHANKALALMTDDVNKEIAERNQRLSDDLNTAVTSLKMSTESAHSNKSASDTDLLVNDIDDILDEIVTARIDPDQLNNSTIQVMAVVELLDEVLKNYGDAFAVGYDMTNMSMMTMDGNNNTNNSSIHSISTLINTTDYQTAQALAMKVQELFNNQIMNSSLSEGSETADQTINSVSAALEDLVTSIDGKASPMDIMMIVHTRIHPNLMSAFGLQLENG
ncbi:MAG: hypothetical protein ACRD5J_12690 [Nitrososphaeraceae archaeon]